LLPHSTEDEARSNETAIIAAYGTEFMTNERMSHLFKDRRAGPRNKLRLESYFVYTAFMSVFFFQEMEDFHKKGRTDESLKDASSRGPCRNSH